MRRTNIWCAVVLLAAAYLPFHSAEAYTITVQCQINSLAPPTRPWQNADCFYSWAAGGNAMDVQGSWVSSVSRWSNGQLLHEISRPQFDFYNDNSSPNSTFLLCTNLQEVHRFSMTGTLWRLTIGGTWGAGGWSPVTILNDYALPSVTNPVPCT